MKGNSSARATPLMISAMRMACSSLSMTQGPAIRNNSPDPMLTSPTWNVDGRSKLFHRHRRGRRDRRETLRKNSLGFFSALSANSAVNFCSVPRDPLRPMEHLNSGNFLLRPPFLSMFVCRAHKCSEQRMRLQRLRFELGMKLAANEMRMVRQFHHLHISTIG